MADLAVSLLSADFSCLEKQLQELKEAEVKWLHIDVMDGNFVPSISFGFPIVKTLRKAFSGVFDVHLMIQEPIRYIKEFAESGSDILVSGSSVFKGNIGQNVHDLLKAMNHSENV